MSQFLLVLDEGTTSTRAMLFRPDGTLTGSAQRPLTQHYPTPGQVEHDAAEIWANTLAVAHEMVDAAGGPGQIAAVGITNQRETVVAWDRSTGEPIGTALVWQDRRTANRCAELKAAGHEDGSSPRRACSSIPISALLKWSGCSSIARICRRLATDWRSERSTAG